MSCFRGQMNEYTSIAIDRFDGKNLHCTVFFLSHCHKDHMIGLNNPQLLHLLRSKENIFIYVTEITRLLLLSEEMYQPLEEYIRVLDIGVSQPVKVPSNNILKVDYCVNVTPIPAGHCPGSVMFLFEGCEGASLYTGDFRWEIDQASKIAALRNEDGSKKKIKSLYVDTTFCIPEAYQIPSRVSCMEATATLVADWLHQSPLHVVSIFCPARYGHEHLLMELANRLDTKVHVPDWKAKIYDQIPDLQEIFTSNPAEARIHSCSTGMGHPSSQHLPCHHNPPLGGRFRLLNIRPSTMWFTSEKSRSRTEDLIVIPASNKGLHRACYSMHSSYSEIRDLVSYLQPEWVLPNVLPASDANMEIVKKRLRGFLSYPHKSRTKEQIENTDVKPLGILKQRPNNALSVSESGSLDELVFSSQEQSPKKPASHCASKVTEKYQQQQSPQASYKRSQSGIISDGSETLLSDHPSKSESSYNGSANNDEELDLFDDEEKLGTPTSTKMPNETSASSYNQSPENQEESFRLYVSGDSDVSDDDRETDVNEFEDYAPLRNNLENTTELENKGNPLQIESVFVNVKMDKCVDKLSPECDKVNSYLETANVRTVHTSNSSDTCNQAKAESSVEFQEESKETECYHVSKDEAAKARDIQEDEDDEVIPNSQGTPTKTTPLYCKGRARPFRASQKQEKSDRMNNQWDGCLVSPKENTSSKDKKCLVNNNLNLICPSPVSSHEEEGQPECDADSIGKEDVVVISSLEDAHSSQSSESQTFWDRSCNELGTSHALNTTVQNSSVKTTSDTKKSKAKLDVLESAICDNDEKVDCDDEESLSKQNKVCMNRQAVSSVNSINGTLNTTTKADPWLTKLEQIMNKDWSMDHQLSLKRKFNASTQPLTLRTDQGFFSSDELKSDMKKRKQIHCSTLEDDSQCFVIGVDLCDDKALELKEENTLSQSQFNAHKSQSVDQGNNKVHKFESSSSYIATPSVSTKLKCKISDCDDQSKSSFLLAKKSFCQSQTSNLLNIKHQNSTTSGHIRFDHSQNPKKRAGEELTNTDCFVKIGGKAKASVVPEYLDLTQPEQKIVLDLTGDSSP